MITDKFKVAKWRCITCHSRMGRLDKYDRWRPHCMTCAIIKKVLQPGDHDLGFDEFWELVNGGPKIA